MALKYDKLLNDYDKHCQRIAKSTTIRINETPAEKVRRMRHLEADYTRWFSYYFPNFAKKPCAWFHKRLANKVIENRHIRALAEWYRSAAKSVHIDMGIPFSSTWSRAISTTCFLSAKPNPKPASSFPPFRRNCNTINASLTITASVSSTATGLMAISPPSTVSSSPPSVSCSPRGAREDENRPDYIVIDDVDNKRHVNNDRLMREAIEFITEDVWGTFDTDPDATDRFIYANNNFHKNSITNRLHQLFLQKQQQALQDGDTTNYYLLKVCAVKNLNDFTPNGLKKPMPPTGVRSSTTSRTVPSCASSCTFTFRTVPSSVTKISYGDKCFLSKSTMASASTATFPIKPPETTKPCSSLAK